MSISYEKRYYCVCVCVWGGGGGGGAEATPALL